MAATAFLIGDPNKAEYDFVLKRSSLEEMFKPQIAADEKDVSLGLTFFIEKRGGLDLIGHSGGQNGFISHFYVHQASRSAFIVAYNTEASSELKGDKQSTRALDHAVRDYFVATIFPAIAAASRPTSSSAAR